mmetsp:Transcript_17634/g.26253  ORF Transcript_17634/g.26253 Transcript_17634/m.26253 type:complete len:300 (-) Transcript_17634:139-1038(-)|eukprot:CAMPEP_0116006286 /NCGR_PEP_ID=MMETSP0321-20121206/1642_1 /TAXON_ID=163516 /ORGANISM="Leptocylindrus danicus var. danicus, Strain B650" /LENGTH=299 /DNA_ID=CAMNT_0003474819 /DNA_START=2711 /DNA_END=3610 /DNA_ORIENTATION=-
MPNIRTITDIQQDQHSVQSITLRGNIEDASVQTFVPRPVFNDDLREMARERLQNGDYRLPIRTDGNGLTAGDAEEIRNLNANLDEESIRNILENVSQNRFNEETLRILLSNVSTETLNRTRSILNSAYDNLQDFAPILNIMIYANVGFYDFNASSINLSYMLTDLEPSEVLYENNLEEVTNEIDENVNNTNDDVERRSEEYNRERTNILSSLNWHTAIRRGGTLLFMSAATYLGAPYLGMLGNLGARILENSPNIFPTSGIETGIAPRSTRSGITWNHVSESFWGSWALLARYMGGRSD